MTDPKMHAYCVTVSFTDGGTWIGTMIAPAPEGAAAICGIVAGRQNESDPTGTGVLELTPEWLRSTLRQLEGEKPSVVSLVQPGNSPNQGLQTGPLAEYPTFLTTAKDWSGWGMRGNQAPCPTHPDAPLLNGRCPLCSPTITGEPA